LPYILRRRTGGVAVTHGKGRAEVHGPTDVATSAARRWWFIWGRAGRCRLGISGREKRRLSARRMGDNETSGCGSMVFCYICGDLFD
jgi:hypothetical protein